MVGGPLRFDVQVARAGVSLRLAAPVTVGAVRLTELTLDLGRVPPPLDLSSGAAALRHRRSRVASLHLEVSHAAMVAHAEERGVSVEVTLEPESSRFRLEGKDSPEPLWVFPVAVGADWLLVPIRDGGPEERPRLGDADALSALLRRAAGWGGALPGAARLEAPTRRVLAEAFATRGMRVPSLGALPSAMWVGARSLHYASGDALHTHGRPPELAGYIADIASLIERSAGGGTGALLREAAARLDATAVRPSLEEERPTGGRGA